MSDSTVSHHPLALDGRSLPAKAFTIVLGSWVVAASAWVEVPMLPVPMTMQTLAILVIGALCGWRIGAATLAAYLAQGAAGLPMFAGGAGGAHHLVGPTAGYLFAFPVAAALTGWLARRGWNASVPTLLASMLLGHVVILVGGVAWLSTLLGVEQAVTVGLMPFWAGTVLKSALAAALVTAVLRVSRRQG